MTNLVHALERNSLALMESAKSQHDAKVELAKVAESFSFEYGGKTLTFNDSNYLEWTEDEMRNFLEQYKIAALNAVEQGSKDKNAFSYLDTEGLGLSFETDFSKLSLEEMQGMYELILTNYNALPELTEQQKKLLEDSIVSKKVMTQTGRENALEAQSLRQQGENDLATLSSRALLAQSA
jgi:hypothetical protein